MAKLTREQVIKRIKKGESLANRNLSGLDLSNAKLLDTDLPENNLTGAIPKVAGPYADMDYGVMFHGANLKGANLSRTNLHKADLTRANLSGANLSGADLSFAKLTGANLTGANLWEANLDTANLRRANLAKAGLFRANLSEGDLSSANLQEADLRLSRLSNANLSGANISGVKLFGSWLVNTKLDNIICEFYDNSENADGSDIRHPKESGIGDVIQTLGPMITITSHADLDAELLADFSGLIKVMQSLKTKVNKLEKTSDGGCSITFETAEEKSLIPTVIVLFDALLKEEKIDLDALSQDMGDLNKIVINGRPLVDLLKDVLWLVDSPQLRYGLPDKFRKGFISEEINIHGESLKIERQGGELHVDYSLPSDRHQAKTSKITTGAFINKIIEYLLTH